MNKATYLYDIEYGCHERQRLDIFFPEKPKKACGVILFIHGGGWQQGDKSGHRKDIDYFCRLGYISAAINYRFVAEDISVFEELDDITSALKVIKEKCAEHGYSAEKLLLSGGSAGGHLSLLYAYTRMNEAPIKPVAACVYCPPVDCTTPDFLFGISGEFEEWKYSILSKCCGVKLNKGNYLSELQQAALKRISPQEYVNEEIIPTAVFQGKFDELIPFEHIIKFIALLNEKGIDNDLLVFENSGHTLDKDPDMWKPTFKVIDGYAEKYL